ncbi:uncharacterized protein LOC143209593 isoform X2 [Lasioglossum baleicum]|uniref:uncharacterized protein LOC143209593 isoform X2 n=1 Tax=Lasioglossum baleicum TaxID=434251 RepID=UPI003FCCC07D
MCGIYMVAFQSGEEDRSPSTKGSIGKSKLAADGYTQRSLVIPRTSSCSIPSAELAIQEDLLSKLDRIPKCPGSRCIAPSRRCRA